ncbi:MAG: primosomal protein N' [Lachnospiraceae bacterium]|nr:primosomal protein N' [Lachnospiraceae bacterium]
MKYANIIVNISHENLDRTFQYIIPSPLQSVVEIGSLVRIPFGKSNKLIEGYVLDITDEASFDESRLKEIVEVVVDSDVNESKLIKLAEFIKNNYGSTMINALKIVLPVKKKIKAKEEKSIILNISDEEAENKLSIYKSKHQNARARILTELINDKVLDYALVTSKLNISSATIKYLEDQNIIKIESKRVYRNTVSGDIEKNKTVLNEEQKLIADDIIKDIKDGNQNTYLIRGITGSGKTEIYMDIIDEVVAMGKQAIVLIPEIALTYQTVMRFYKRYGDHVSTLHSKLSDGERYDQFVRAKNHEIDVMIGPRSALFTPFDNIGVIIIDEEHEGSYKSEKMPRYHAREVASELARLNNAALILGSATPSITSYYRGKKGQYKLYELDKRAKEATLPDVKIVDLRDELKSGNKTMFSRTLKEKMEERLMKGEQIMLFLNRRGYSGFVSCRDCGEVIKCPHCDVSLSEHKNGKLVCHYCGYETTFVKKCPKCGSTRVGGMKVGTEHVEEMVKKMFPVANVLRMDSDTTKSKDSYNKILSQFANKEADILIGTQMIVKGHDFPYVTLVGILLADMSLHVNDYRASERTFQLITQAAGRAGRGALKGDVVIQTYSPDDFSIIAASHQDYREYYDEEIKFRQMLMYPPVGQLMVILCESEYYNTAVKWSDYLAAKVKSDIIDGLKKTLVIGPCDASIVKIQDIYRRVIYVKSLDYMALTQIKDRIEQMEELSKANIRVSFDFNPLNSI